MRAAPYFTLARLASFLVVAVLLGLAASLVDPRYARFLFSISPALIAIAVVLLVLVALGVSLRRQRRYHHRVRHGLCVSCGYDVRASRDACPECNMPILRRINPVTGEEIRDPAR